uniref:Uncharacterized protein n=1 Tax=Anopheles albimanus TaxID=7167 RepID=A0A182F2E7_ANOAL
MEYTIRGATRKVSKRGYLFVAPDWDFSNPLYRTKSLEQLVVIVVFGAAPPTRRRFPGSSSSSSSSNRSTSGTPVFDLRAELERTLADGSYGIRELWLWLSIDLAVHRSTRTPEDMADAVRSVGSH